MVSVKDLERQRAKDEQVLAALENAGSDLSKPHRLEHHFECANRAQADRIVEWARNAGYQVSVVKEGMFEGKTHVYFDVAKSTVPTLANVSVQTTAMLRIAAQHGAEYDGWGCEIVRKRPNSAIQPSGAGAPAADR